MGALVIPARHRGRGGGAVLTIGNLGANRVSYYMSSVAKGAEEYYTQANEAPGQWLGKAASSLGLTGRVREGHLRAVFDGQAPDRTWLLRPQGRQRRVGWDCTFSDPKSVSLLYALGSPEVRRQVREAHDAAVEAALAAFEAEACRGRRGHGGKEVVEGDGFVAAAFRHRTSREGRSAAAYPCARRQPRPCAVRRQVVDRGHAPGGGVADGHRVSLDRCST